MVDLRVRKPDGWTTVSMPDDAPICVAGGKVDNELCLTLIATPDEEDHVVKTGILDVDKADEQLLQNDVPRNDDGTSIVLDQLLPD